MRTYAVLGAVLVAVVACQDATSPRPTAGVPARVSAAQDVGPNDYIVTFRDDEADPEGQATAFVRANGGSLKFVYRYALKGFAVANLPDAALEALQRNPRVASIEPDGIVTADDVTQTGATWGIDRIDQRDLPLSGTYTYQADGTGVTAYIIDTGIQFNHVEFGGRASGGYDAVTSGGSAADCNGHGTHVAGTVGGSTYGVAKNVALVAVRVLGCSGSGSTSGVIAGIDWVTQNHAPKAVANMSLGGSASLALDNAVEGSVASGVTYAVAAGNSNANACNYSPARAASAITVGATTSGDAKASFSNYGTCVDINAPGVSITSAWWTSNTATNTISGTSMASPHVAGAAAAYLSANTSAAPGDIDAALKGIATANHISGLPSGTPNRLLYVGFSSGGGGGGGGGSAPAASLTKSCSGFTCTFTDVSTGATNPTVWTVSGGTVQTATANQRVVRYEPRESGFVRIDVSNSVGSSSATQNVNCNPRKCQ